MTRKYEITTTGNITLTVSDKWVGEAKALEFHEKAGVLGVTYTVTLTEVSTSDAGVIERTVIQTYQRVKA